MKFSTYDGDDLASILADVRAAGATEEDFKNIKLEISYENCYYESDPASLIFVWDEKKK